MTSQSVFDYARPYDLMVGVWAGIALSYDANGNYQASIPSMVAIYWKRPYTLLHYRQDELPDLDDRLKVHPPHLRAAVRNIVHHNFDLEVNGKVSTSTSATQENMRVAGLQTRPGIYLFHLMFPQGHYYNNQYFTSPNERHIIGPYVAAESNEPAQRRKGASLPPVGSIANVVSQTFTRISYDVDTKYKRAL